LARGLTQSVPELSYMPTFLELSEHISIRKTMNIFLSGEGSWIEFF